MKTLTITSLLNGQDRAAAMQQRYLPTSRFSYFRMRRLRKNSLLYESPMVSIFQMLAHHLFELGHCSTSRTECKMSSLLGLCLTLVLSRCPNPEKYLSRIPLYYKHSLIDISKLSVSRQTHSFFSSDLPDDLHYRPIDTLLRHIFHHDCEIHN